jgi:hypothetical protein
MAKSHVLKTSALVLCILQAGSPPDVWLQLLKCCVEEPDCQLSTLCSLGQQLVEQRAEHSAVTDRQQQEIAGLQEQLSAQQEAAAEQIAGLQEQLQRLQGAAQPLLLSHKQ